MQDDDDSIRRRRGRRMASRRYGVLGIVYGVSGPSHVPTLNPNQFGAENTELTSSTAEDVGGDDGGGE